MSPNDGAATRSDILLSIEPITGLHWQPLDPFLFCAHHADAYPKSTPTTLGPDPRALAGRRIGMDFDGIDGWRMYHGDVVPGFPQHPHRGFETVTLARRGYIDHSDSLGATARFGQGDVQWLTAGKGIVHAEMFPLVRTDADNPTELFQIWLNLPRASKMVDPYFSMFWASQIPRVTVRDDAGRETVVTIIAGALGDTRALPPPPDSWASQPESDVAILTLRLAPHARFTLPAANRGTNRALFFFDGETVTAAGERISHHARIVVRPDAPLALEAGDAPVELLLLQGRPIGEPVVQYGPFVMNTPREIQEAIIDYRRTQFGGWPFDQDGPVHPRDKGRFARHADGRTEDAPER